MQHSLLRQRVEVVKLFSRKERGTVNNLKVYEFSPSTGLTDITPIYTITSLNNGYYSTEIQTPDKDCYLLILFNYNPIVLRVGSPTLQFFYWNNKTQTYPYEHYNEFGDLVSQGNLNSLLYGFNYYTPISDLLGYIEVNKKPFVLNIPYNISGTGVGINVDWRKTIIRQQFSRKTNLITFKLNTLNNKFNVKRVHYNFNINTDLKKFNRKIIKQEFKVSCKS